MILLETIFKHLLNTHSKAFLFYRIEQALRDIGINVKIIEEVKKDNETSNI